MQLASISTDTINVQVLYMKSIYKTSFFPIFPHKTMQMPIIFLSVSTCNVNFYWKKKKKKKNAKYQYIFTVG